jgi:hypothetical protein
MPTDIDHIAYSFIHGGFDPDSQSGGCSCHICYLLRTKIVERRNKEGFAYFNEKYGQPPVSEQKRLDDFFDPRKAND